MEFWRGLRNGSIAIYICLFMIGGATGVESISELWNDVWHTPNWKRETKEELRRAIIRRQTGAENLKDFCEAGVSFAGVFMWFPILLTIITAAAKNDR